MTLQGFWSLGSNTNLTFTKSGSVVDVGWVCLGFTGVDNTTPIDATGTTSSNTGTSGTVSLTVNAVTVATSQAWEVFCYTPWNSGTITVTPTATFNNVVNAAANEQANCFYNPTALGTGSTGTVATSIPFGSATQGVAAMPFALRPAGGAAATSYPASFLMVT